MVRRYSGGEQCEGARKGKLTRPATVESYADCDKLLVLGALPTLVKLATEDDNLAVRKKAVRGISCATRNYQPALDAVVDSVPPTFKPENKLDAGDMASVDILIDQLRKDAERAR